MFGDVAVATALIEHRVVGQLGGAGPPLSLPWALGQPGRLRAHEATVPRAKLMSYDAVSAPSSRN